MDSYPFMAVECNYTPAVVQQKHHLITVMRICHISFFLSDPNHVMATTGMFLIECLMGRILILCIFKRNRNESDPLTEKEGLVIVDEDSVLDEDT